MADRSKAENIRCWACDTACNTSQRDGRWLYSMACDHELAMAYDRDKWEATLDA